MCGGKPESCWEEKGDLEKGVKKGLLRRVKKKNSGEGEKEPGTI